MGTFGPAEARRVHSELDDNTVGSTADGRDSGASQRWGFVCVRRVGLCTGCESGWGDSLR
jgi:hypothetical protein